MICCIFNHPAHYRENIYLKMEKELGCDFYFGVDKNSDIRIIDYNCFSNRPITLKVKNFFSIFTYTKSALSLTIKSYDKYVLIAEPFNISNWLILLFNKILGKKTYLWGHGWYGRENLIKRVIKKIFFKLSDGSFLYGHYAKNLMIDNGIDKEKLHVVYNSLDYENQIKLRNSIKESRIFIEYFNNNNYTLIFIGRLTKVKKLEYLLDTIKILESNNLFVNLVIVGKGEEEKRLKDIVFNEELNNVWFYGESYNENEISNLIFNADLCVSPGNVGLTAMHSMMYGTPVITHDNFKKQMPEFEAVIQDVTGGYFNEDNVNDLSLKIMNFFKYYKSNKNKIKRDCNDVIDKYYNPNVQIEIFRSILGN